MYHIATPSDRPVDTPGINKATPPSGGALLRRRVMPFAFDDGWRLLPPRCLCLCCGPYRLCLCMQQSTATKTAKKPERRREGRREGETDASSRHRLKISFQFGPRRRRLLLARPIDRLGSIRRVWMKSLCNSATCQALSRRFEACLPPLASLPLDHGRCFQYCFCQMSAVAQSAMQPGASSAGCCAERGMCHPSEGRPSLERGIHPRMSDVGK